MASKILIVDDEPEVREMLNRYLTLHGYECLMAGSGAAMREAMADEAVSLVILDLNLAGEDGLELARELRAKDPEIGLIIVTARGEEADRVVGLELGADDYIGKPFSLRELVARIKTVLRRVAEPAPGGVPAEEVTRFARWTFSHGTGRLTGADGREVMLTPAECSLLRAFLDHAGETLSREMLQEVLSRGTGEVAERTIDVQVKRLRDKIEANPRLPQIITTVRGGGYALSVPVSRGTAGRS